MSRFWRRGALVVLWVSLVALVIGAGSAHEATAGPQPGDWESTHGATASFELTIGKAGRAVLRDVVIMVIYSAKYPKCRATGEQPYVLPHSLRVGSGGRVSFTLKKGPPYPILIKLRGHITARSAQLVYTEAEHNPTIFHTPPYCATGKIRLTAKPATRSPIKDGTWKGTASDGNPVRFTVSEGGRVIRESACHFTFIFGNFDLSNCSGSGTCADFWGNGLFISPNGRFGGTEGSTAKHNYMAISGTFTGDDTATGSWNDQTSGDCQATWTAAPG
jgi:hypothetical protein